MKRSLDKQRIQPFEFWIFSEFFSFTFLMSVKGQIVCHVTNTRNKTHLQHTKNHET